MKSKILPVAISSSLAVALVFSISGTANAYSASNINEQSLPHLVINQNNLRPTSSENISPELIQQAYDELIKANIPKQFNEDGTVTFTLESLSLTMGNPREKTMQPRIGGGLAKNGVYIDFNSFDQTLIENGSGLALGTAICLIPAVGTAACVFVQAIIAVATAVISNNRSCKGILRIYFDWNGVPTGESKCLKG